jgi:hypothetical protein
MSAARAALLGSCSLTLVLACEGASPGTAREWHLSRDRLLSIPSTVPGRAQVLHDLVDLKLLADGSVIVANGSSESLLTFDSRGALVAETGRPGEGPGELSGLRGFDLCGGDTLAVRSRGMVSFFGPDGAFVRARLHPPAPDGAIRDVEGVSSDCSELLAIDRYPQAPSTASWPYAVRWIPASDTSRTLFEFQRGPMTAVRVAGREVGMRVPYGPIPVWHLQGDVVFLGLADAPQVEVLPRIGDPRTLRWSAEPSPLTDSDRQIGAQRYLEAIEAEGTASVMPRWSDFPLPRSKPFYHRILVDDEGNLWVHDYPTSLGGSPDLVSVQEGVEPERWRVYSPSGAPLGTLSMPAGFELRDIRGGTAAGVFRDALGVESVTLYRVER